MKKPTQQLKRLTFEVKANFYIKEKYFGALGEITYITRINNAFGFIEKVVKIPYDYHEIVASVKKEFVEKLYTNNPKILWVDIDSTEEKTKILIEGIE